MRNVFFRGIVALSLPIMLISGCAKDTVKPDEGIAPDKTAVSAVDTGKQAAVVAPVVSKQAEVQPISRPEVVAEAEKPVTQKSLDDKAAADNIKLFLKTITFDFDSYVLSQTARDILYSNADYLLKKYKGKVKLEGHCDERGSDEYNLALGENRAKSALNYLLTLGVPAEQLSIVSYGKERPLDNGHTEEAWAKNRRVEFTPVN